LTSSDGPWLLDVNVLLALAVRTHMHHGSAGAWFAAAAPGRGWATTPVTESGLVRLLLNAHVYGRQLEGADAVAQLGAMRRGPAWTFLADDSSLADPLIDLTTLVGHRQVTDLHLLNLAARHGATLATLDRALPTYLDPADRYLVEVVPVH
jgi:toxin-antitoxin system PIN domain toxin